MLNPHQFLVLRAKLSTVRGLSAKSSPFLGSGGSPWRSGGDAVAAIPGGLAARAAAELFGTPDGAAAAPAVQQGTNVRLPVWGGVAVALAT